MSVTASATETAMAVAFLAMVYVTADSTADVKVLKCCGENEMLNSDATTCVPAPWTNFTVDSEETPFNASWLREWLPPGLPHSDIATVLHSEIHIIEAMGLYYAVRLPVRSSAVWLASEERFAPDQVLFHGDYVVRRKPGGGVRLAEEYCIDAVQNPFPSPFVLLFRTRCTADECVRKCCSETEYFARAKNGSDKWSCVEREEGEAARTLPDLAPFLDAEVPFRADGTAHWCPEGRLTVLGLVEMSEAQALLRRDTDSVFSTTQRCVEESRRSNGTHETLVARCYVSRYSRGFYWCVRPLTFMAIFLLVAALVAISFKSRMRGSTHGWALACHASCLLGFNVVQVVYFLTISDEVDASLYLPDERRESCLVLAFAAYFLLSAAGCWLTAVCWNLSTGFKATRLVRSGGNKKRFMLLSVFAWGLPALLTIVCVAVYTTQYDDDRRSDPPWYLPSLLETRTCFKEVFLPDTPTLQTDPFDSFMTSSKVRTALYYYLPMASLTIVNIVCIVRTARKVQYLRRGNSVLQRDRNVNSERTSEGRGEKDPLLKSGKTGIKRDRNGSTSDPKSMTVYIKLILTAGVAEITAEAVAWASSQFAASLAATFDTEPFAFLDHASSYRAVGYCTDLLRAAIVLWLASPERGDLQALRRRLGPCGGARAHSA